jgi:DNA-binding GntR family transcriptional regulator
VAGKQLFQKIHPTSLSQQALEMLRETIMSGELAPGDHLNERAIAQQMGISRVPVRAAIQQLEHEGLVVSTPNRGSYVRYFDAQDINEIFDLRAVLEGLACQTIVEKGGLSPTEVTLLEEYIEDQGRAVAANDYQGWVESEIQFHTFLCKKAGSRRLLKTWRNLHVQCLFAERENWIAYRRAYGSHPVILDAQRQGDPDELIPLHQEIYKRTKASALELMRTQDSIS